MTFTRRQYLTLLGIGITAAASGAQTELITRWQQIAAATDGMVGAAVLHTRSGQHAAMNGTERFPLASVCKFPIALRIFALADSGKLNLNDDVEVLPRDVMPSWHGDLASLWPNQRTFKLDRLIRLMLAKSDNTAVQTLFRIAGEQPGMDASFRHWRVTGIRVDRYEGQCNLASHGVKNPPPVSQWTPGITRRLISQVPLSVQHSAMRRFLNDPRDTATPTATVQLLARAFQGKLLSRENTAHLAADMEACTTGNRRIKGLLPPGTVVAHKTGTTDTIEGLNGATNDVGVITLPRNQGQLAIAVYIKGSTRNDETRDNVIARIARVAYDHWTSL